MLDPERPIDEEPLSPEEERFLSRVDALVTALEERSQRGEAIDIEAELAREPELAAAARQALHAARNLNRLTSAPAQPPPPAEIGDFQIVRELGQGGMGVVYEAIEQRLGRRVALKLLPQRRTEDPRYLERFRLEARAAARMQHPGIVTVHGFGEAGGVHYYSMQYIEGVGLDRLIALVAWRAGAEQAAAPQLAAKERPILEPLLDLVCNGSLSGAESDDRSGESATSRTLVGARYHRNIARLVLQAAEALEYAHSRGVLHRDVKPSNLLVDADGRVYVTDFGLAKTEESSDLTREGDLVGTLRYMAPEQFQGHTDPRSDVYSLGLVLYELLALRPAFDASQRPRLVHDVLYERPPRPRQQRPEVPLDLERIVLTATSKLPEERYPTARALAEDLRRWLEGRPIAARAPSAWYLTRLALARNRAVVTVAALMALLLVLGGARHVTALAAANRAQRDATARAALAAAEAALVIGEVASARAHLAAVPVEGRGWPWAHLSARTDQSLATLAELGEPVQDLCLDGEDVVVIGRTRSLRVAGGAITEERPGRSDTMLVRARRSDPETWITLDWNGRLWRNTGSLPELVEEPLQLPSSGFGLLVDPASRRAFVAMFDASIAVVDIESLTTLALLEGHRAEARALALADGVLFSAGIDGRLLRWETRAAAPSAWVPLELNRDLGPLLSVAATSDARTVFAGGANGVIYVLDGRTGAPRGQILGHIGEVTQLALTRDDGVLVSTGKDRTLRLHSTHDLVTERVLSGHARHIVALAVDVRGERLVTGSYAGIVKDWDSAASGGAVVLAGHIGDVVGLALAPDGKHVATGGRDTSVRIWDLESERLVRVLLGQPGEVSGLAFDTDGQLLVSTCRRGGVIGWTLETSSAAWRHELTSAPGRCVIPRGTAECWVPFNDGAVRVFDLASGALRAELTELFAAAPGTDPLGIAATSDGATVFVGTPTGELLRIERASRRLLERVRVNDDFVNAVAVSPRGDFIATGSRDRTVALAPIERLALAEQIRVEASEHGGQSDTLEDVAFDASGELLAVASRGGQVRLLDLATRAEVLRLSGHTSWVRSVAFTQDGQRLLSTGSDGALRLWDTESSADKRPRLREARRERWRALELAELLGVPLAEPSAARSALLALPLDTTTRTLVRSALDAELGTAQGLVARAWEDLLDTPERFELLAALQMTGAIGRTLAAAPENELLVAAAFFALNDKTAARAALQRWERTTADRSRWRCTAEVLHALVAEQPARLAQLCERMAHDPAVHPDDAARARALAAWAR